MPTGESSASDNTPKATAAPTTGGSVPGKYRGMPPGQHLRPRPLKLRIHSVVRWLHIYTSMFSLLATLFFALTGITLNHPDWVFGTAETKSELKGTFPTGWKKGQDVDWLTVTEYLRKQHGVKGFVDEKQSDETEGSVNFKAPGYSADCFFQTDSGKYELSISAAGAVAVMNDFHRGQNAGTAWKWVIDISGAVLAFVALTGLGLLFYLKKVRVRALIGMAVGAAVILILMNMVT